MTRLRAALVVLAALSAALAMCGACWWASQQLVAIALPLVIAAILALS